MQRMHKVPRRSAFFQREKTKREALKAPTLASGMFTCLLMVACSTPIPIGTQHGLQQEMPIPKDRDSFKNEVSRNPSAHRETEPPAPSRDALVVLV